MSVLNGTVFPPASMVEEREIRHSCHQSTSGYGMQSLLDVMLETPMRARMFCGYYLSGLHCSETLLASSHLSKPH